MENLNWSIFCKSLKDKARELEPDCLGVSAGDGRRHGEGREVKLEQDSQEPKGLYALFQCFMIPMTWHTEVNVKSEWISHIEGERMTTHLKTSDLKSLQ